MSSQSSVPEITELESFIAEGFNFLTHGLGPFVSNRTGTTLSQDPSVYLRDMLHSWNSAFYRLGSQVKSGVECIRDFRNLWAHRGPYTGDDVLLLLLAMRQVLRAVSAGDEADGVEALLRAHGALLFRGAGPERRSDPELSELRQQVADMQAQLGAISSRLEESPVLGSFVPVELVIDEGASSVLSILLVDQQPEADSVVLGETHINPRILTPQFFLGRGWSAVSAGNYDAGCAYFSRALELDSRVADEVSAGISGVHCGRGAVFFEAEDFAGALSEFSSGLDHQPTSTPLFSNRALTYERLGNFEDAFADWSEALRLDPGNHRFWWRRARLCLFELGEYDRSVADFTGCLRLQPGEYSSYFLRAQAHWGGGHPELAIPDFDISIEMGFNIRDSYLSRGICRSEIGDYAGAVSDISEFLKCESGDYSAYLFRCEAYLCLASTPRIFGPGGDGWLSLPRPGRGGDEWISLARLALADCDSAVSLAPEVLLVYNIRGVIHLSLSEFALAGSDFNTCIRLSPESDEGYFNRGTVRREEGSYADSLQDFRLSLHLFGDDRNGKERVLAQIRLAEELRDGVAGYDRAVQEAPDDPANWHLRGLFYLGVENFPLAVDDFNRALAAAPGDAEVLNDLGWGRWRCDELDEAYNAYSRAIELNPSLAQPYYNRAWVSRRRQLLADALSDFSLAIACDPDYAAAYEHRGICYFDLGDFDAAQQDFDSAKVLGFRP